MGPAAKVPEPAGLAEAAATEAVEAGTPCRGASRTGARRTGRSLRGEPHCGAAPGSHGAAWPGPGSEAVELLGGSCCDSVTVGLADGGAIDPALSPASGGEPPCTTVAGQCHGGSSEQ